MYTIDRRIALAEQARRDIAGHDRDRSRSFDYYLLGALMESATDESFARALSIAQAAVRDLDRIGAS